MDLIAADRVYFDITLRLIVSLIIGGLIGLERSFHDRPAGFRTHALVCLSTCLLMLLTVYGTLWVPDFSRGRIALDPTRMAQGIMTGIGFLGAGTIIKDGLSVRGLTTAASIWTTAAIGILIGVGFYIPAALASLLTLVTLSLFGRIENRIPTQIYCQFVIRFARGRAMSEAEIVALLSAHGFKAGNLKYRLDAEADFFEYEVTIRTLSSENTSKLSQALNKLDAVKEYRISPAGD